MRAEVVREANGTWTGIVGEHSSVATASREAALEWVVARLAHLLECERSRADQAEQKATFNLGLSETHYKLTHEAEHNWFHARDWAQRWKAVAKRVHDWGRTHCNQAQKWRDRARALETELAALRQRLLDAQVNAAAALTWQRAMVAAEGATMDRLQAEVGAWADRTFPSHRVTGVKGPIYHLADPEKGEARELLRAYEEGRDIRPEAADCAILALVTAYLGGFSLLGAVKAKFAELQGRRWGPPDEHGVCEHIREEPGDAR